MLRNKTNSISVTEECVFNEETILQFYANVNEANLDRPDIGRSVYNWAAYKENRADIMLDQIEFEDKIYELIEQLNSTGVTK